MKNQKTIAQLSLLVGFALVFIAAGTQQDKNQDKKEKQQKESKQQPKQKENDKGDRGKSKDYKDKDERGNSNRDDRDDNNNNDESKSKEKMKDGYKWDRETFKERKKYRNSDKVTICHKFNQDSEAPVTISVSSNALKAHLNHGDVQGDCPAVNDNRYSDNYWRRRTDYYNIVQVNYEQVDYSKSILEYALQRLGTSRQQLATMQSNKMPLADIQRKQVVVVELEQNVSLLQTLVGVAANIVVNKLQ